MSHFKLNIDKLNLLLLPAVLRKPVIYGFCKAFSKPIKSIYMRFMARRQEILFTLKYDSGKYNIERYLNRSFSDGGNDVYITFYEGKKGTYLSQTLPFCITETSHKGECTGIYLGSVNPVYVPFYIDATAKIPDFVVNVPSYLSSRVSEINNSVSKLALPGYTFSIEIY